MFFCCLQSGKAGKMKARRRFPGVQGAAAGRLAGGAEAHVSSAPACAGRGGICMGCKMDLHGV